MGGKPIAAGKSSFDYVDVDQLWPALALQKKSVLLDMGCGIGNYAVAAAPFIGPEGVIYALDAWAEGIDILKERAAQGQLTMIRPVVADISRPLPLEPQSVDLCLMATVVHDIIQLQRFEPAMQQVQQVLRADGRLAVVEFKKINGPPGPPPRIRLSPDELEGAVTPFGFHVKSVDDIGPYHYLAQFVR